MEDVTTLDQLPVGRRAAVAGLSAPEDQQRRLLELGFVPGGEVLAVQESPWGDTWQHNRNKTAVHRRAGEIPARRCL